MGAGNIGHALLAKGCADDVARKILQPLVVAGPERVAAVDIETAVAPVQQVVDEHVADFALGFEHLEHLVTKHFFHDLMIRSCADQEPAIARKTTVRDDDVNVKNLLGYLY